MFYQLPSDQNLLDCCNHHFDHGWKGCYHCLGSHENYCSADDYFDYHTVDDFDFGHYNHRFDDDFEFVRFG